MIQLLLMTLFPVLLQNTMSGSNNIVADVTNDASASNFTSFKTGFNNTVAVGNTIAVSTAAAGTNLGPLSATASGTSTFNMTVVAWGDDYTVASKVGNTITFSDDEGEEIVIDDRTFGRVNLKNVVYAENHGFASGTQVTFTHRNNQITWSSSPSSNDMNGRELYELASTKFKFLTMKMKLH